jgi:hypothetical protein
MIHTSSIGIGTGIRMQQHGGKGEEMRGEERRGETG